MKYSSGEYRSGERSAVADGIWSDAGEGLNALFGERFAERGIGVAVRGKGVVPDDRRSICIDHFQRPSGFARDAHDVMMSDTPSWIM